MLSFVFNTLLPLIGKPVLLIKDGLSSIVTKSVRETCYWVSETDTSSFNTLETLGHYSNPITYINALERTTACEHLGNTIYSSKIISPVLLASAAMLINKGIRKIQYNSYTSKTADELNQLTIDQASSFLVGVESSKSNATRCVNLLRYNTYLHPIAFYAGFEAARQENKALIDTMKAKVQNR